MLVHNKGKYVRHAGGFLLVPGANDIEANDFKQFSSHPLIQKLIEIGEIVPRKNIKDLNVDEAVKLIKDTFSLSLLEEWAAGEKRKGVLDAITAQLDDIQGLGEKDL